MEDWVGFLVEHGAAVLFFIVLAEQIGLPLPAVPFLLAAGALAGAGQMNLGLAIAVAVLASLIGDFVWYYLGVYRGRQALALLCRISLEPDSCVRRTESFFVRHGMWSLVFAKFFPGLNTVMPALAGLFKVTLLRFVVFNGLKDHDDDIIKNAQEYIEQHYHDKLTVDQIADQFNVTRRTFERRFKKATYITVAEYIQRVKIEAAKKQLEIGRKSITEVMVAVGYSDTQTFRDVFKRITDMTPVEYRNKYNK